jgi:hypothetical protein
MESAKMAITIAAGLLFSLSCAVLIEELIFGGLFRLFFARRSERPKSNSQPGRKDLRRTNMLAFKYLLFAAAASLFTIAGATLAYDLAGLCRNLPLVGSIQGMVMEAALAGPQPAANVTIILDHNRTALSDASGHFAFADVPEGVHEVALDMEGLPADYSPGTATIAHVSVAPRATALTDFNVVRLANLEGKIVAPKEVQVENVVVRLVGTKLYTTPYPDGAFTFYNLREGQYEVEIDPETIPEGYLLAGPARVAVAASSTTPAPPIGFELKLKPQVAKPVREMLNQEIHVKTPGDNRHH